MDSIDLNAVIWQLVHPIGLHHCAASSFTNCTIKNRRTDNTAMQVNTHNIILLHVESLILKDAARDEQQLINCSELCFHHTSCICDQPPFHQWADWLFLHWMFVILQTLFTAAGTCSRENRVFLSSLTQVNHSHFIQPLHHTFSTQTHKWARTEVQTNELKYGVKERSHDTLLH